MSEAEETKVCNDCGEEKPLSEFRLQSRRTRSGKPYREPYCTPCRNARNRSYYNTSKEERTAQMLEYRWGIKQQAIERYGGACDCCGEDTMSFLTLTEKELQKEEPKQQGWYSAGFTLARYVIKHDFPDGYIVLCFNCEAGRVQNGICPHKDELP